MHLKIITHEKVVFDEEVDEIYTKTVDGEIGILTKHVPIMSALDIGVTKAVKDGEVKYFTTMGGVLQFKDDEALIIEYKVLFDENTMEIIDLSGLSSDDIRTKEKYDDYTNRNISRNIVRNNLVYSSFICIRNALICMMVLFILVSIPFNGTKSQNDNVFLTNVKCTPSQVQF